MNSNFDGVNGMYGVVLVGALAELSSFFNRPGQSRRDTGRSWKRVVLMLAVIAAPVLLLAGGLGS